MDAWFDDFNSCLFLCFRRVHRFQRRRPLCRFSNDIVHILCRNNAVIKNRQDGVTMTAYDVIIRMSLAYLVITIVWTLRTLYDDIKEGFKQKKQLEDGEKVKR